MTAPSITGVFRLKPGIRVIPKSSDGIVIRDSPLRAFRVNPSALAILDACRNGFRLQYDSPCRKSSSRDSVLALLDRLFEVGLLDWVPGEDKELPFVSIIVPVYNRAHDIGECLDSLTALDYPSAKREIVVVDDGSRDDTPRVVATYDVRVVTLPTNEGQSEARNKGVKAAKGEIIAFIDSDCVAHPAWLRELVPYFQDSRTVLVGGYVAPAFGQSLLDRYEEAKSPLCMGKEIVAGSGTESEFYVPTCNLLVRKAAYLSVGGLREDQRVGEDVDLCWKLKEAGYRLLYVPKGTVRHKHRNSFVATFVRRFEYGTSEPLPHQTHTKAAKRYPWNTGSMVILSAMFAALFVWSLTPLIVIAAVILLDSFVKKRRYQRQMGIHLTAKQVLKSTAATHLELVYQLSYHAIRYYLVPICLLGMLFLPLAPVAAALVLFPSLVEFFRKHPRLPYPVFLFFFIMEQVSYQAGVLWGCLKCGSFRTYRLMFLHPGWRRLARAQTQGK